MDDEVERLTSQQLSPERLERAREAINFLSNLPTNAISDTNVSNSSGSNSFNRRSSGSRSRELLSRCNQAISRLQRSRQCMSSKRKLSIREEMLCTLRGGSRGKTKKRKCAWKHKFVCLAYKDQQVPIREAEKDELFAAGLGEKEIEFDDLCSSAESFRDTLYETFPQLEVGGGYQLLKCIPNTRQLEPLSGLVMESPLKLKQRVGTARTYIRPLQKDLDTTPIQQKDGGVKEKCLGCGQVFSTCDLPEHLRTCDSLCLSDSDDEFSQLPPWRRGPNEESEDNNGLRRCIDELRSRAVIPSDDQRQPTDSTQTQHNNQIRPSNDPRRPHDYQIRTSVDPRVPAVDQGRPNDDQRRQSDGPRRPSDDQRSLNNDQRRQSDDFANPGDDQRIRGIDPGTPYGDHQRRSNERRIVDLTADEYETEQHILEEVASITMNVDSPVAPPFSPLTPKPIDLNSLLNELQLNLNGSFTIEIRRSHLLFDALKEAKKKKFNPMKNLRVSFVGEAAVDDGGPRREFFRLFIQRISESEHMHGGIQKFFTANMPAILNGNFKQIGYYAGMSTVQHGPGFPLLTNSMFHYMSTGELPSVQLEDENLPLQIKSLVTQVKEATTNQDLRAVFNKDENESLLLETGYKTAILHLEISERANLLSVILNYHCMLKAKAANDQFLEGLQVTGVLDYVKKFPEIMKPLFCVNKSMLTVDCLKSLFDIAFCDPEDPNRAKQEATYVYFADFLDECEAGENTCSLEEVLIFCSGADCVPPMGFHKKIDVVFLPPQEILPTASTCNLELRIPTCYNDQSSFNEKMELALKCGMEFGLV